MMSDDIPRDDWPGCPRDDCYFCRDDCHVLEEHHIVPDRHGGNDADRNKVTLCPTCHEKLERLYDKRFYDSLGVGPPEDIVQHVTQYVAWELERIDVAHSRALGEIRDRIGAAHLKDGHVPDDLRERIDEAISEYHAEQVGEVTVDEPEAKDETTQRVQECLVGLSPDYDNGYGVARSVVVDELEGEMAAETVEHTLDKMLREGMLSEPTNGHVRWLGWT